jgi:membrane protease YdiL (CAAX protease family)
VKATLSNLGVDETFPAGEKLTTRNRLIATWEIVSVVSSFVAAEWVIRPFGARENLLAGTPLVVALIAMALSHYARGDSLRTIGWRIDNLGRALRALLLPTLGAVILIAMAGWAFGGFGSSKLHDWRWLLWLPVWALIQQYALQGFINQRAQIAFGIGYHSILLVAFVFALLHLPNFWLAIGAFIGGLVWGKTYQRFPNLLALSLSHALISLTLVAALPTSVLRGLRVGIRYFA